MVKPNRMPRIGIGWLIAYIYMDQTSDDAYLNDLKSSEVLIARSHWSHSQEIYTYFHLFFSNNQYTQLTN